MYKRKYFFKLFKYFTYYIKKFMNTILVNNIKQTLWNISFKSAFGLTQDAIASQKKIKSSTTPAGFTLIMLHTPLKAESFSTLSRIFLKEMHLFGLLEYDPSRIGKGYSKKWNKEWENIKIIWMLSSLNISFLSLNIN